MCLGSKPPKAPPVQLPQAPQAADKSVVEARNTERRRVANQRGGASTDVTGGMLDTATTARKTALGQ